ncbi:unnamed protein product [Closterium sp. NIES-53]
MAGPEERGDRVAGGSGEAQAQGQPRDSAMAPMQPSLGPPRDEPRVFGLDKFNGDNFAEWSFKMENIVDHYDLLEVMEGTEKRPENDPEKSPWVRKSAQGYLLLGQALGSSQIRHIKPFQREPEKGPKAWAALKGVHAPATAAVAVVFQRQMAALRIEEDEAVEEGVQKFFDLLTRLEGADLNYSELQKKTKREASDPSRGLPPPCGWRVRMAPGQQASAEGMAVEEAEDEGEADLAATTSMEAAGVADMAATTRATDAVAADSMASATIVTRADICGAIASSSLMDGPLLKAKRVEEQEEGEEEFVEAVEVAEVVLQDVTFDKSVPFYHLFPYHSAPLPPPPLLLFLAPGPPSVDPLPLQGPAPSGVSQVDPLPLAELVEVTVESSAAWGGAARGVASGGAEPASAEPGEREGAEPRGAEPEGTESGGAEPRGPAAGGPAAGGPAAGGNGARDTRVTSLGGARDTAGAGGAGAGGTRGARAEELVVLEVLELETVELEALELETLELEALELEALELEELELEALEQEALELETLELEVVAVGVLERSVQVLEALCSGNLFSFRRHRRLCRHPARYFVRFLSQPQLQLDSPLPAPSPYTEHTDSLTVRREPASRPASPASRPALPICAVRTGRRVPHPRPPPVISTHITALFPSSVPLRFPLQSPPASSLADGPDPKSDLVRVASPTITRLLATVVTDPSFKSTAPSALATELVDFAAPCRLDNAASLVLESASVCPPSVRGECALGTDVLEVRQEDFECLAAAVPHLVAMLLAPKGDPDAPDIPTPRSYLEAIMSPHSSKWQTAMDAEMASWKSTGTYVDAVPPPGANIVDGMWIFRGVHFFQTFSPTPKMTFLRVLLHVVAQRDYELHSLDFSTAFLQRSLHEEIWLRRPPSFTGSFPAGTQWSLRRPVYGLRQAPREWHDTLRTTRAALGFAPSTADPSLFLRTNTLLPPFYILVYVDDLVFATTDTEALALVKSKFQKRHTCNDLGPSALSLPVLLATVHSSAYQSLALTSTFGRVRRAEWPVSRACGLPHLALLSLDWSCDLVFSPTLPMGSFSFIFLTLADLPADRLGGAASFSSSSLQQRGQLCLAYVASRANTADVFTKALGSGDHQRFYTALGLVPTLPHLLVA